MLKVLKFGGTSVGTLDRIQNVANIIKKIKDEGHDVIAVVSAMSGETNKLIEYAEYYSKTPKADEIDMLLSSGERVTSALLSIALNEMGYKATSMSGRQAGIITDNAHTKARIEHIDTAEMKKAIKDGNIIIVAGFQGVAQDTLRVSTLGRGGSDLTAVAIAGAIEADVCEIYTDVDGIYTVDPRAYAPAKKLDIISYEEMMEMSNLGAGVMEVRAVELGKKYGVEIYVARSLGAVVGTYIKERDENMEAKVITGLSINDNTLMVAIRNIPNNPKDIALIFDELGKAHVNVDMISQSLLDKEVLDLSFTCPITEEDLFDNAIKVIKETLTNIEVSKKVDLIKISLVGIGMMSHSGVAATVFQIFAKEDIKFYQVTTSEISISYTIDKSNKEKAVNALGKEFNL